MRARMREQLQKQCYKKPKLRVVELMTKEVLVVGCKNSSGTAVNSGAPPCWASNCQSDGS